MKARVFLLIALVVIGAGVAHFGINRVRRTSAARLADQKAINEAYLALKDPGAAGLKLCLDVEQRLNRPLSPAEIEVVYATLQSVKGGAK